MNSKGIVVGLDIGTTKICAIVGKKNDYGKLEILGMGKAESLGVMRGVVANIDKTVQAIKLAISEAETKAGVEIKEVYVGIAGQHIKSVQNRGILTRMNNEEEINGKDISQLIDEMYRLALPPGDKTIHVLPQEFIVDNEQGIKNPIGMAGNRLEANFHIITGQISAIKNIYRCVEKADLVVKNLVLEPLASASAVLNEEEREAGIALVDIGGGTTDIAIFQDDIIRHTAVIPFGGNVITEDIKNGCRIMRNQAELLKVKFGSALAVETPENQIVSIPGLKGRPPKEISVKNLAHIIQARMEEIIQHVYYEIDQSGYSRKLIGGIVVTGGGARLNNLKQLLEYNIGMDARIGIPNEHLSKTEYKEAFNPMFSTGVGLILKGFEDEAMNEEEVTAPEPEMVENLSSINHDDLEGEKAERIENKRNKGRWYEKFLDLGKEIFDPKDEDL